MKHASLAGLLAGFAVCAALPCAARQDSAPSKGAVPGDTGEKPAEKVVAVKPSREAAVSAAARAILAREEKDAPGEWPYEGVYRVEGKIPIGYRVGGSAICAMAMMETPEFAESKEMHEAVQRAMGVVIKGAGHPLMSVEEYNAGYDVRGWGYTYGLMFLLEMKGRGLIGEAEKDAAEKTILHYIEAIEKTEIPQVGGWNYARPPGKDKVAPPSPFMTAPTLQALFEAKKQGYMVDGTVVGRALAYLESSRAGSGAVAYSGGAKTGPKDAVPGAVGRMLATETTLFLAGRGSQERLRGAVDAFIVHWEWLNQRRAKPGTHMGPYNIAPYYFYYAHYYAARAVEMLPENERAEYRRRVNDLLFATRNDEDGSWNDRVFDRSASYGSSMAVMVMMMPDAPKPAGWTKP